MDSVRQGFNTALHLGICSRKQRCRNKKYIKIVNLYNCFCNKILVSTFLPYLPRVHEVKVEKIIMNMKKSHKMSHISEFLFSA